MRKAVKRVGRADGRTRTLEPEAFFSLLDYCLSLIEDADGAVARAEAYLAYRDLPRRSPWPEVLNGWSAKQIITEARLTYGACIVLAFSLLGSRKHQLALLDVCDLPSRGASEDSILAGRVSKTSNGPGGTATAQPVIGELERALRIVVRLTGVDLNIGTGPLFRCLKLDEGLNSKVERALDTNQVYRLITNVAKAADIKIVVRPHMFRRAFSMLYVWRYELGDLQHLSRFLHHNSLSHTIVYAQGDDVSVFMGDAQRELAKSIMERAITGQEPVGGSLSALLRRLATRLRSQISLLRSDQIDDWIESKLTEGQFTLKAAPHGYCLILGSRGRRSMCSTDGRTPDYGNRTDEHCAACGNFVFTERSRQYWEQRVAAHEQVAKTTRLPVLRKAAQDAIAAARHALSTLGL
ncbi:phage integrase family protein [Cognatilysobacter segetis]|uniref:phage integrase family protein n=1 Tax=Cognatilysobacter segetis TaxID=2492394 RepID=UPI00139031B1|nr:phage integrase family protein [Lysobacter segetis]